MGGGQAPPGRRAWAEPASLAWRLLGSRAAEAAGAIPACPVSHGRAGGTTPPLGHWPCPSVAWVSPVLWEAEQRSPRPELGTSLALPGPGHSVASSVKWTCSRLPAPPRQVLDQG